MTSPGFLPQGHAQPSNSSDRHLFFFSARASIRAGTAPKNIDPRAFVPAASCGLFGSTVEDDLACPRLGAVTTTPGAGRRVKRPAPLTPRVSCLQPTLVGFVTAAPGHGC